MSLLIDKPISIKSKEKLEDDVFYFLGINISCLSSEMEFLLLASICFLGFWLCGYYEELIFGDHKFKCGWFLATFELCFFCIVTSFVNLSANISTHINTFISIFKEKQRLKFIKLQLAPRSPIYIHCIIGCAMTFARSLTLFSLIHLNYPTQVIFKSMKLLFVLLGSYLCFGLQYSFFEIIGHISMVIAAILFSLGDHETQTRFTLTGLVLVLTSLIFDSIHANYQEYALRKFKCNINELMIYSNGIAAFLSGIACILTQEIHEVIAFVKYNPNIWFLMLIRSTSIYVGAVAYLGLTKRFGAVSASEVTTARKVLTIITSYYLFPKPFITKHSFGSISFAFAIFASIYAKRQKKAIKPKVKKIIL
eukprot:224526_1